MKIHCLASSSAANAYVLDNGKSFLMVEAGLEYPKLRKALTTESIDLMQVGGCLITHAHGDHCKGANDLSRFITVYASQETIDHLNLSYYKPLIESRWNIINNEWKVIPFGVQHDIAGAYGFIIKSNDQCILFVNDTKLVEWNLSSFKFDYVMIECNYNDELIDLTLAKNQRTINSHMALSTTITTLKTLDLSQCKAIYLMHLSSGNSNEKEMIQRVKEATNIDTFACQKYGGFNQ